MVVQEIDVAVVGAGISSVTAGYYLQKDANFTYQIYEARHEMGGTWSVFNYPGVRSDSDMYSFGFPFNPWSQSKAMAEGHEIRQYIEDTAENFGIKDKIHFRHSVKSANWSSGEKRWTLNIKVAKENGSENSLTVRARFLYSCTGYYNHNEGYYPELPGSKAFQGRIIRPQFWPQDLDYSDQSVAVIGSGATACSVIPALARKAKKVTMIQRSPSYIMPIPLYNKNAIFLQKHLPAWIVDQYLRFFHMLQGVLFFLWCRFMPQTSRRFLRNNLKKHLPTSIALDPHFDPAYLPWEQRLCMIPDDGEFFDHMATGKFDIVTGVIDTFVSNGIRMKDGNTIAADIVVQATGLDILLYGGISIFFDGEKVNANDRFQYRGIMLEGVPNFAHCMGYIHSSWTLGANLNSQYVVRLLNHIKAKGYTVVTPRAGKQVELTKQDFALSSGYLVRALDRLPKVSDYKPWTGMTEPIGDWYDLRFRSITKDLALS